MDGKKIVRFQEMDAFLDEINQAFYYPKNKAFYELVRTLNKDFFAINDYYYSMPALLKSLNP